MKIRDAYKELGFDFESPDAQIVFQQPDVKGRLGLAINEAHSLLDRQIQTRIGSRDMVDVWAADGHATYIPFTDGTSGRVRIIRVPHRLDDYIGKNPKPFKRVAG